MESSTAFKRLHSCRVTTLDWVNSGGRATTTLRRCPLCNSQVVMQLASRGPNAGEPPGAAKNFKVAADRKVSMAAYFRLVGLMR